MGRSGLFAERAAAPCTQTALGGQVHHLIFDRFRSPHPFCRFSNRSPSSVPKLSLKNPSLLALNPVLPHSSASSTPISWNRIPKSLATRSSHAASSITPPSSSSLPVTISTSLLRSCACLFKHSRAFFRSGRGRPPTPWRMWSLSSSKPVPSQGGLPAWPHLRTSVTRCGFSNPSAGLRGCSAAFERVRVRRVARLSLVGVSRQGLSFGGRDRRSGGL